MKATAMKRILVSCAVFCVSCQQHTCETPAANTSTSSSGSTTSDAPSNSSATSSGGAASETGDTSSTTRTCDPACDVDSAAPLCEADTCVPCNDNNAPSCETLANNRPICDTTGRCVQCQTNTHCPDPLLPLCDETTGSCVACTAHDQCPGDAACNLITGECFPEDTVYDASDAATLTSLLNMHIAGDAWVTIRLSETILSNYSYTAELSNTLAILGANDEPAQLTNTALNTILAFGGNGTMFLDNLRLRDAGTCLGLVGATAHVTNATFSDCTTALSAQSSSTATLSSIDSISGDISISSSTATLSSINVVEGTVIATSGAEIDIVNAMLFAGVDSVALSSTSSTTRISYSTIYAYNATGFYAVTCSGMPPIVTASIVANRGDEAPFQCAPDIEDGRSVVETNSNTDHFGSTAEADLHLTPAGFAHFGAIPWQEGDPEVDFDGEPRRSGQNYPGADVPTP